MCFSWPSNTYTKSLESRANDAMDENCPLVVPSPPKLAISSKVLESCMGRLGNY